jgi:hypothetical protein
MNIRTTRPFDQDFAQLPESIKRRSEKQFQLLLTNPRHPSLRLKKMEDPRDIWEGRITKGGIDLPSRLLAKLTSYGALVPTMC